MRSTLLFVLVVFFALALSFTYAKEGNPGESMEGVLELNDQNFHKAIDGKKHALVEFYAPWCVFCKLFAPKLKKLGSLIGKSPRKNDLTLAKVDASKYFSLAETFKIEGYPTVLYFEKGNPKKPTEYEGEMTLKEILDFLHKKIDKKN